MASGSILFPSSEFPSGAPGDVSHRTGHRLLTVEFKLYVSIACLPATPLDQNKDQSHNTETSQTNSSLCWLLRHLLHYWVLRQRFSHPISVVCV